MKNIRNSDHLLEPILTLLPYQRNSFQERVEQFSVVTMIFYAPKDKSKGYMVGCHVRDKKVCRVSNSNEEAKALARSAIKRKGNGELDAPPLTSHDRGAMPTAVRLVENPLHG